MIQLILLWVSRQITKLFPKVPVSNDPLDQPLFNLSATDTFTFRMAYEGCSIMGQTGSGKTSGSGQLIAKSYLRAGFGGVILTAKPDETQLWQDYCRQTGRLDDLMIISPQSDHRFNFLDYEANGTARGSGISQNIVNLLKVAIEAGGQKQNSQESYWQQALDQLLRNAVEVLMLAGEQVSVASLYQLIQSAPQTREEAYLEDWQNNSYCFSMLQQAERLLADEDTTQDFLQLSLYWMQEFAGLADKTRSIIINSFSGMADAFLRGDMRKLFCTDTTLTPDDTFEGKIIVIDLPVMNYQHLGKVTQTLFKYCWQKAVERRTIDECSNGVFLWADESQHFISEHDALFQTTARSQRAATVYLTQNLPNYRSALGGKEGQDKIDSLLGNLSTKIFHNNGEFNTNKWASDTIDRDFRYTTNYNFSDNKKQGGSSGFSEQNDYRIRPIEFTTLKTGGPQNDFEVEAILYKTGKIFNATKTNYIKISINQKDV